MVFAGIASVDKSRVSPVALPAAGAIGGFVRHRNAVRGSPESNVKAL
jgi:hypothetical protein